ncbi:MAG: PD-(D/E)XK nuclease family transposase [Gemmataceae bacterium]|nr:PD-(D/E)XK nuclease family transposase [Gemmataceae bacterium]
MILDIDPKVDFAFKRIFGVPAREGEEYGLLQPTYSICFVDDMLFPDVEGHHSNFRLRDAQNRMIFAEELSIHLIELPKFRLALGELTSELDRWSYFLRHAASFEKGQVPVALDVPPIRKALEVLAVMTQSEIEREQYEARLKKDLDHRSVLGDARRQVLQARKEALEQGVKQGIEQGVKQGIEQGVKQGIEQGVKQGIEQGVKQGIEQGVEHGAKQGEIRRIHSFERLLKRPQTPTESLLGLSIDDLTKLADQLETDLSSVVNSATTA